MLHYNSIVINLVFVFFTSTNHLFISIVLNELPKKTPTAKNAADETDRPITTTYT